MNRRPLRPESAPPIRLKGDGSGRSGPVPQRPKTARKLRGGKFTERSRSRRIIKRLREDKVLCKSAEVLAQELGRLHDRVEQRQTGIAIDDEKSRFAPPFPPLPPSTDDAPAASSESKSRGGQRRKEGIFLHDKIYTIKANMHMDATPGE